MPNSNKNWFNLDFGNQNQDSQPSGFLDFGSLMGGGTDPSVRDAQINVLNAQAGNLNQMTQNSQFGLNFNTLSGVMDGLNSLGQLWGAYQGQKLAKDQWKTQKSILNTNMMNQISSYNSAMKDRLDTRAHMEGRSQESADAQLEERKARRYD